MFVVGEGELAWRACDTPARCEIALLAAGAGRTRIARPLSVHSGALESNACIPVDPESEIHVVSDTRLLVAYNLNV